MTGRDSDEKEAVASFSSESLFLMSVSLDAGVTRLVCFVLDIVR